MYLDEANTEKGDYYWMIKNTIVPRPIAWISTVSADGVANVAPYSFFNLVTLDPAIVEVCFSGPRDTLDNLRVSGDFVVNIVSEGLVERETMTAAILPADVDEAQLAGLGLETSRVVSSPRLVEAKVSLECVFESEIDVHGTTMVFGRVVGVHVNDAIIAANGRPDYTKFRPVGRMGGSGYAVARDVFEVKVPVFSHLLKTKDDVAAVIDEAPGAGLGRPVTLAD